MATQQPAWASRQPIPNPMTPAPMITVFGRNDETVADAVIADSLRRASPARFSGSDLSRPGCAKFDCAAGQHPSLPAISDQGVADARTLLGRAALSAARETSCRSIPADK